MLAGNNFAQVKQLIDRGVAADNTFPTGTAYLLNTLDSARSVRAMNYAQTAITLKDVFPIEVLKTNGIENRKDVLFYFTGLSQVPKLDTLQFQPGALADHLTSFGGMLTDSSQMSALRWLEAGATASYGTVVEPCSHLEKFPYPAVAMYYYAKGESAIESYWKSVAWPGEGVFVGEPLAKPFAPLIRKFALGQYELSIFSPTKSELYVESAKTRDGPFSPVATQFLHQGLNVQRFGISDNEDGFLSLRW